MKKQLTKKEWKQLINSYVELMESFLRLEIALRSIPDKVWDGLSNIDERRCKKR